MRPTVQFSARLLPLAFAVALLAAGCGARSKPLHVTYYYLPDVPASTEMRPAMTRLEKEFPGKVDVRTVDATTPEAKRLMDVLGFHAYGLVIHGRRGELLWKQPDHTVNLEEVRQQVRELLAQHDTA